MPRPDAKIASLPCNVPDDWHARIQQIVAYWQSIHPQQGLPGRQHFDPVDIPDILANIRLLDVHRDPLRFKTRLMGTVLRDFFGQEQTGRWMDDCFADFHRSKMYKDLCEMIETRQPQWRRGQPTLAYEKNFVTVERVYLPFASDGATVDMIVTCMLFGDKDGNFR